MAITRKLVEITVTFAADGTPSVDVCAVVTDDSEGTMTGANRRLAQAAVVNAAVSLRDAVVAVAANAGKPVSF